jgi:hypothetical protein
MVEALAQKKIPSRIYTPSGFILGTFHVAEEQSLVTHLETNDFFTLTDVTLPRQSRPLAFLALQRSATILVVPSGEDADPTRAEGVVHQVSCLLHGGVVMGALRLPASQRVSDHLMGTKGFVVLRDCTIGVDESGRVEATQVALVNARAVVGVAEM